MEKALADKTKECEQAMESATKKHEIGLRWQKAFTENRATLETRVKEVESKQAEIATLQAEVERLTKEAAEGVAAKDEELETLKKELEALKAQVAQSSASDSPAMVSAQRNLFETDLQTVLQQDRDRLAGLLAAAQAASTEAAAKVQTTEQEREKLASEKVAWEAVSRPRKHSLMVDTRRKGTQSQPNKSRFVS